jgi:hypothetical protein
VFDLWIDACEEAFAEAALSPEYRHIYGELVNGQMRARQCGMAIVEEQLKSLGLPSRTELDSNHKRTYELQRELRALKLRVAELEQAPKSAPAAEPLAARPLKSSAAAPAAARPAKPVAAAPARAKPRAKPAKPAAKAAAKRVVKASASRKKSLPPLAAVMPKAPARARKGR